MAREESLNIYQYLTQTEKDDLAEVLGGVVENIQTECVSEALKNKTGSGDPEGGSIVYKRFANAELADKGTARTGGKGAKVLAETVTVNIDDDKEIIEELQKKDIKLYGISGMAQKRSGNAKNRVKAYLDRKFFTTAVTDGTAFVRGALTDAKDIVDAMIVKAKNTQSAYIDGIDADDLALVLNGTFRKALKNELDELPHGTTASNGAIGMYDSITVYETNRLPENVNAIVMLKGAIAQPYYLSEYSAEKVPFDDAVALELFLYNGCESLNPEAIIFDRAV